jgi:hypothetical protein
MDAPPCAPQLGTLGTASSGAESVLLALPPISDGHAAASSTAGGRSPFLVNLIFSSPPRHAALCTVFAPTLCHLSTRHSTHECDCVEWRAALVACVEQGTTCKQPANLAVESAEESLTILPDYTPTVRPPPKRS